MRKLAILAMVLIIVVFSGCITQAVSNQREFGKNILTFRTNITEASSVPVFPDDETLLQTLRDPFVSWIHIVFIPNETENGFYYITAYELAAKLNIGFKAMFGSIPSIDVVPINDTPQQPARDELIIWMRGPGSGANQTAVTVDRGLVIVEGDISTAANRTVVINKAIISYTNLELAADRLLLTFLWPSE